MKEERQTKIEPIPATSLWRNGDFVKLWSAQTVSMIGSKVSFLALPLTAAIVLQASPVEMGMLSAAGALPALLFGLLAGVWADRKQRRRLMIFADVGRGGLLLLIPLAAWQGWLQIDWLVVIAFLSGSLSLLFGAAYHAYLPSLVHREALIDANSKLEFSRSAAEIVGPTLSGWLIQIVSAPFAILVDALTFFVSAFTLALIKQPESMPKREEATAPFLHEMVAGLRLLAKQPLLRAITISSALLTFFNAVLEAVYLLYMTRHLNLSAGWIGLIFGTGSIGFLMGALLPAQIAKKIGMGRALILGVALATISDFTLPLVGGPPMQIIAFLIGAQICFGLGLSLYAISQISLRQGITPEGMLGRVNGSLDFTTAGLLPLGALLGGWLGEQLGLRQTLLLAASGELLAVIWLLRSPLRSVRSIIEFHA